MNKFPGLSSFQHPSQPLDFPPRHPGHPSPSQGRASQWNREICHAPPQVGWQRGKVQPHHYRQEQSSG